MKLSKQILKQVNEEWSCNIIGTSRDLGVRIKLSKGNWEFDYLGVEIGLHNGNIGMITMHKSRGWLDLGLCNAIYNVQI